MNKCSRRCFIARSMAAAGAATIALSKPAGLGKLTTVSSRVLGANEDIRVAIVGLRKKGKQHIDVFRSLSGVRVVALCDADTQFLDIEVKKFKERNEQVDTYVDYRRLLENKNIDAVVIVTPDHWHALMTIWACQAGKDVYVEKPASHNIWEGRRMVEAARKYERIVQTGTQNQSDVGLRKAISYIRHGNLGRIVMVRGIAYNRRKSIGKVDGPQPIPASVDYNLFMGPAPLVPLMRKNLHYDWHWFWDTGTGEMGNLGAHIINDCRWAIGQHSIAPRAISIAGRFGYDDDGQTPNTHIVFFDYKPVPIVFEVRGLPRSKDHPAMDAYRWVRFGMVIECEQGYFAGGRGGGWAYTKNREKIRQFPGDAGQGHQANFIQAMRSRNVADLRSDILEGHISSILCHMANISYRLGQTRPVGQIKEVIHGNEVLVESFERLCSHLRASEVDIEETPLTVGPMLTIDAEKERFIGEFGSWANMFIKRNYREHFVVPEQV